jgi:MerR family transcriptional regulator, redox-sensitive transcriptional activator SoxR
VVFDPDANQRKYHGEIIGTDIADTVKGQEAVEMVAVNDQLSKRQPAKEQGGKRRKAEENRQLGKVDVGHLGNSSKGGAQAMPVQVRLKSSGIGIGELARIVGLRASAIRYYESIGLMPEPARRSGARVYAMADVRRMRVLVAARKLGFSVADLKPLSSADRDSLRAAASAKALSIRKALDEIAASAATLEALATCQCVSDADCGLMTIEKVYG